MKPSTIFALCMIITIVSFLGFAVENIWLSITKGYMDNRGMYLPFLLGYGLAMVAIYLMFGTPLSPRFFSRKILIKNVILRVLVYLFIVCLCVSVGEIILGTFVEKTCGIIWWNYTRLPLHITKYTSIPTSLGFGILITTFMHFFFTPLFDCFTNMNYDNLHKMACNFMLLLVSDFIYNSNRMYRKHKLTQLWRIDTTKTPAYMYLHS